MNKGTIYVSLWSKGEEESGFYQNINLSKNKRLEILEKTRKYLQKLVNKELQNNA